MEKVVIDLTKRPKPIVLKVWANVYMNTLTTHFSESSARDSALSRCLAVAVPLEFIVEKKG